LLVVRNGLIAAAIAVLSQCQPFSLVPYGDARDGWIASQLTRCGSFVPHGQARAVASTRSVTLIPAYVQDLLPSTVISRPLAGDIPTIALTLGYRRSNTSQILKFFLSHLDELIARVPHHS
jgi:hypothetical protein